jgi:chromodomain-helicase-DNA-binding protein 1
LKKVKGYRKVENYQKRIEDEEAFRNDPLTSPEEIEQLAMDLDLQKSLIEDYKTLERVIATREIELPDEDGSSCVQYLCKWNRLDYSEATWESADDISDEFQADIDAFLERNQSQTVPHRSDSFVKNRSDYKPFQKQPDYLVGGELRDFQLLGVNWMAHLWHNNLNGILADEMVYFTV